MTDRYVAYLFWAATGTSALLFAFACGFLLSANYLRAGILMFWAIAPWALGRLAFSVMREDA